MFMSISFDMNSPKIVLIGAGNLSTNLGYALKDKGFNIVQVYSNTSKSASALAETLNCAYTNSIDSVVFDANIYILALKDSVLEEIADELLKGREEALFIHTSGSMQMDILKSFRRGVVYPMQTFSKSRIVDFCDIPIFIEASTSEDETLIESISKNLSNKVYTLDSNGRMNLHIAAVFCCNFANHCYAISEKLLLECGVPFNIMLPLITETSTKLNVLSPTEAQTGPAVRNDKNVINKHLNMLESYPAIREIYKKMSDNILDFYNDRI